MEDNSFLYGDLDMPMDCLDNQSSVKQFPSDLAEKTAFTIGEPNMSISADLPESLKGNSRETLITEIAVTSIINESDTNRNASLSPARRNNFGNFVAADSFHEGNGELWEPLMTEKAVTTIISYCRAPDMLPIATAVLTRPVSSAPAEDDNRACAIVNGGSSHGSAPTGISGCSGSEMASDSRSLNGDITSNVGVTRPLLGTEITTGLQSHEFPSLLRNGCNHSMDCSYESPSRLKIVEEHFEPGFVGHKTLYACDKEDLMSGNKKTNGDGGEPLNDQPMEEAVCLNEPNSDAYQTARNLTMEFTESSPPDLANTSLRTNAESIPEGRISSKSLYQLVSTDVASLLFAAVDKEWKEGSPSNEESAEPDDRVSVALLVTSTERLLLPTENPDGFCKISDTRSPAGLVVTEIFNELPSTVAGTPSQELHYMERATGLSSNKRGWPEVESDGYSKEMAVGTAFNWENKLRGNNPTEVYHFKSHLSPSKIIISDQRKKSKVLVKEQTETILQLSNLRLSCHCEEISRLGPTGNVDRFSLDITKAWRDYKAKHQFPWAPQNAENASKRTVCEAWMSIGEKLYGCCRQIPRAQRGNLYRTSPSQPLIALCDIHAAHLRYHNACPGCGIFCEIGKFRACSIFNGHLYHDSCSDEDKNGQFRCRHCLRHSDHVFVTVADPGIAHINFISANLDPSLMLAPRQPALDVSAYRPNLSILYSRDFTIGFSVSCSYLPPREATQLEKILKKLSVQEQINMEWYDLFWLISTGNLQGVIQFINNAHNLEQLYRKVEKNLKQLGLESQYHFSVTGPVHLAVKERQLAILAVLLQAGFPMNHPDRFGFHLFEQAAMVGSLSCLNLLRKFYSPMPCSAVRETSLRRFLQLQRYDCVAILLSCGFYILAEFSLSDNEQNTIIESVFKCRNPVAISHFARAPEIISILQHQSSGTDIIGTLLTEDGHDFAIEILRQLGVHAREMPRGLPISFQNILAYGDNLLPVTGTESFPVDHAKDRIVCEDIAGGRERNRVSVANNFDLTTPMPFHYVTHRVVQREKLTPIGFDHHEMCSCSPDGQCLKDCTCMKRCHPYTKDGRLNVAMYNGQMIFECSDICRCSRKCGNRIVQGLSSGHFQVYKTEEHGDAWGLRTIVGLPGGFFVGKLVGAVYSEETVRFTRPTTNEMHVVWSYDDVGDNGGEPSVFNGKNMAIFTREFGNYARFMVHGPNGNVMAAAVMTDDYVGCLPQVALFTKEAVGPYTSLVLDTAYLKQVRLFDANGLPRYHSGSEV